MVDMYNSQNNDNNNYNAFITPALHNDLFSQPTQGNGNGNSNSNSALWPRAANATTIARTTATAVEEENNRNAPVSTLSSIYSLSAFSTQPLSFASALAHSYEFAQTPAVTNVSDLGVCLKATTNNNNNNVDNANEDHLIDGNTLTQIQP